MIVAKSFFLVRAVVTEPLRDKFDRWYSTDHLPWAIQVFKCEKVWRFWSEVEQGVHYAGYQFVDKAELDAALASQEFKELVADFNRSWPDGVNRTRDVVSLAHDDALCLLHHVAACTLAPSNSFGGRPFARVLLSRKAPIIISTVTPSSQNCRSLSQLPCYRSYRLSNSCRGERT
jgi:hypothetical protein